MINTNKSIFKYIFTVLVLLIVVSSCEEDDDLFPQAKIFPKNIVEILSDTPETSTLLGAIEQTGLDGTLSNNTTFTVFAPSNSSFDGVDLTGLTDDEVRNILLNHVWETSTADFSKTLETGYRTTMARGVDGNNLSFYVNATTPITFNGSTSVVPNKFDLGATNGVVHLVDEVITLPTVVDLLAANPEYSSLATVLTQADLVDTLSEEGPFTVFAPNNDAFEVLQTQLNDIFGWATFADIPEEILNTILRYHVISGSNNVASAVDGETLNTLQGESFSVTGTTINDQSNTSAEINLTDVQGINGVAHGIDKVLFPDTVFQQVLSATLPIDERLENKGYSSFLQAIQLAGLSDTVSTDELTAFAPTNTAFDVFFLTIENFENLNDFDTPEEIATLKALVEYHLKPSITMSNQLAEEAFTTVQGEDLTVEITDKISLIPTRENAASAVVGLTDIGAKNGIIHEIDNVLVPDGLATALGYPEPIIGGTPIYGFEIYNDALRDGMWTGNWGVPDYQNTDPVKSGIYSIAVTFPGGNEGWQIGGANLNVQDYSFVNASIYSEEGTTVGFVLNSQWGSTFEVDIPAGEWTEIAVPISAIANGTTDFSQLVIRGTGVRPNDIIYIDEVGFDVTYEASLPALEVDVYTDALTDGMWTGNWGVPDYLNTDPVRDGIYSIAVTFPGGNEGWQVGGLSINVQDYDFVNASIYSEEGTAIGFVLNSQWGNTFEVDIPAGVWTDVQVPISAIANGTTDFDQLVIRGRGTRTNDTIYIDHVGFN